MRTDVEATTAAACASPNSFRVFDDWRRPGVPSAHFSAVAHRRLEPTAPFAATFLHRGITLPMQPRPPAAVRLTRPPGSTS